MDLRDRITHPIPSLADVANKSLSWDEWNTLLTAAFKEEREQKRIRRAAHTRGFIISLALVLQGLSDVHMWGRV